LAEPRALAAVVLWFSQIVIRHADVRAEVSFNLAYWASVAAPTRSRAEALSLAEHVAELAAREPTRFAELARQYSDDLPGRDDGGALGGYSAVQIAPWPQVLDALSALKPGQTSNVVETPYGFHVFRSAEPPPKESRSGAHIVVGHDAAPWLSVLGRPQRARRTRQQALTRANDIYREAAAQPEHFGELVRRYSEHRDAIADGDFGAWSTREPSAFPPRARRLSELEVGQVGKPIETHLGFEIIMRTPPRRRAQYRAALLVFPISRVDSDAPVDASPAQRLDALRNAEAAARRISEDAASFDGLEPLVQQWEEGRENAELGRALSLLAPGQITPAPVDSEHGFVVARRLAPEPVAAANFVAVLPAPQPDDIARFLALLDAKESHALLRTVATRVARESTLDESTAARLAALHELVGFVGARADARRAQLNQLFDHTRALLGDDGYARYQAALGRDSALLPSPGDRERRPLGF
jgi:parvulin-like peptidyl-prolyl isomerase